MTIVCVDDYSIALDGLALSIGSILPEARIVTFKSVDEALDFVKNNGCDVLITEIEMGGIGGLILARSVQKQNPKVNIIFLTVCDAKEHAREVFNIRPSGYLLKPATKEQLEYELNNLRHASCMA
jgi:YesN/AraC family two-component response regulator